MPPDLNIGPGQVSMMAYSPPYLNHIDYTEVYKVELWLLEFVTTQQEMLGLRKQTLRSHASIAVGKTASRLPADVADAVDIAAGAIAVTGKKWHHRFGDLALAYLADLGQALERQYELLSPGGRSICVVANSAHGSSKHRIPVAVDLSIAAIADQLGFEVEQFCVARQVRRRDHLNRFLRETVLTLRRPTWTT